MDLYLYLSKTGLGNIACLVPIGLLLILWVWQTRPGRYPAINSKSLGDVWNTKAKMRFNLNAKELLRSGLEQVSTGMKLLPYGLTRGNQQQYPSGFELFTPVGERLIFPGQWADIIPDDSRLSQYEALKAEALWELPGLQTSEKGNLHFRILPEAVTKVTRKLAPLTKPLSAEAHIALQLQWTDRKDWHEVPLELTLVRLIAQLTSLASLGEEVCRNPDWIEIAVQYTLTHFVAVRSILMWPKWMHRFVHWYLPACQKFRRQVDDARSIIIPILQRERKSRGLPGVEKERSFSIISWIDKRAKMEPYDPTVAQLLLCSLSIHSSTDLIVKMIIRLCEAPSLLEALREEILTTTRENGLTHTSLREMVLMDSVMKETQRLEPITLASVQRYAMETVKLPNGTKIPKGKFFMLSNTHMHDSSVYPNAEQFDGYRFLRMRENPAEAKFASFTTTSPQHLGFGHGKHACPGRFFVAHEIKIAMAHIILKYDFRLQEGKEVTIFNFGLTSQRDAKATIMVRRRGEAEAVL